MPEILVVVAVFPATLVAAYIAQKSLLALLFRSMGGPFRMPAREPQAQD